MHQNAALFLLCCFWYCASVIPPAEKGADGEEAGNISAGTVSVSGAGVYGAEEENICTVYALF